MIVTGVASVVPPGPVHERLYVWVPADGGVNVSLPLDVFAPLQSPEAVQEVVLFVFQVSVGAVPAEIVDWSAENEMVGAGGGGAITLMVDAVTVFVERLSYKPP